MNDADSLQDYQRVRQQAIRSLFEIVEGSSEGTVIVDREARIVWINQRYAQRFGLADPAQAIGRPCESVIPGSLLREVVRSGKPILLDMMDSAKDPLVVMRLPIHDDAGEVIGAIGFALLDELRSLSPLVTRYLSMQRELASTRSQLQARQAKYSFSHFVGTSPASLEVKRRARRGAASEAPVLLLGETGTGKELLAHAIHSASPRAHKAFVSVNAAAIPESLLEAEFFGTAPGAFTGAERKGRPGKLQVAQGGTLFLDEIGDMPLALQGKLLRVLQEKEFEAVGSNEVIRSDIRLVAATSIDLQQAMREGRFRADLYYRLNVLPIEIPPLRQRLDDLPALCESILDSLDHGRLHELGGDALALLARHAWPGNVRELRNVLERALLLADQPLLDAAALGLLMLAAYRGYSVILFAPLAALGAVLLTDPSAVAPTFTGVFMEKMVGFIKLYFPVFLLGAVFGKLIELAGFSRSIVAAAIRLLGTRQAMLVIVLVCALLTYGGVSLFVVVFAVYPFAAEMFRQSDIPKRLIPATIALGAFSFTMDALPGTPQIQNIIPSTFFGTHAWAAPWLGTLGALFVFAVGMLYLRRQANKARRNGEGYGSDLRNEPETADDLRLPNPWLALSPLVLVGVANLLFTHWIPQWYGQVHTLQLAGMATPLQTEVGKLTAIWAVQAALLLGILLVLASGFAAIRSRLAEGTRSAVAGSLLAAMNTASEYGFGAVIASLPGFLVLADALKSIPNPLVNEAITVTLLAGITGSASGGMSIALAAMSDTFIAAANAAQIPLEVLHRVAAMASGGMDTLPHNGAVITLLAVTGLTHREAYKDIFGITLIKTLAVFFVIGLFYATGLV
ncbi:sigma 54-interacting transcriptional regulator [Pseudomonas aeruginosa]|nr:sigma 54-interacting transcriptional regulator [Pseudomonas aeruginosa]